LRQHGWFDEAALWGFAAEMARLFVELITAALALPDDEVARRSAPAAALSSALSSFRRSSRYLNARQ
jgi:hypothetical protein